MSLVIYTSQSCPNCVRLLDTVHRIPSVRGSAKIVDINDMPPQQIASSGLTAVPTIVAQGRMHVGKEAFDFLAQYNGEIEFESISFGGGSLIYGSLGATGSLQPVDRYGDFTAPPK
jgi:glutaredoxin